MTTTIKPGDPAWVHDHNVRPGNWRTDVVKSVGPKWITLEKRGERFERDPYNDRGIHRNAPNLVGVTGALFSEQAYLDYRFVENRGKIADLVRQCADANTLRAIAALLDKETK